MFEKNPKLLSNKEIPEWMQDNPFILDQFRPTNLNLWECILSLFQWHNQTLNIWTHLIGFVIILIKSDSFFTNQSDRLFDQLMMSITFTGVTISLYCSFLYHTFNVGSSYEFSCFLTRIDYFGIIFHLMGCMITLVYFVYYFDSFRQLLFLSIFISLTFVCFAMNYFSMFSSMANHQMDSTKRALIFISIALISLPPQLEIFSNYPRKIIQTSLTTDLLYLFAALIYSSKCPERFFPGHCDLFSSHTIFHILIIFTGLGSLQSLTLISDFQLNKFRNKS
ncbi:Putative Asparagine synthetase [Sarcoptes scabiei]|nr:Putative Asparagine synthetase [Sarcoptes scabiei]